jgi:outer membrane receptor protein involved in Fe transport
MWQHPTGFGTGANLRFIGTFKECQANSCFAGTPSRDVDRWYKVDLFGSYALKTAGGTTNLTLGVNNVLDRAPPSIYGQPFGDYDGSSYDLKGRTFYARMSQSF